MPDPVPCIDPSTIGAAIEANINAYLLSFARLPGALLHHDSQSTWVDAGIADATFNSVVRAHLHPDDLASGIESVLSHFRRRRLPVTWHIGPSTKPADLGRSLLAHGLTHSEDEPGMAIDLDSIQAGFEAPSGLVIEEARSEATLYEWVSVWLFPVPDDMRRLYFDALRQRGIGDDLPWRYYLGRLDGRPVAISELFVGEGVAAVHYVVTVPDLRRRGIGTAMTLRVVHEARAMGYRVGVLTASPDGIGAYRRLGFREYCWFHRYEWSPDSGGSES